MKTPEHDRLHQGAAWKTWGPYLSDRQWGTVREDYSPFGTAWDYLTHDASRSRAYRWGEDGIGGFSDEQQRLCLALAFWNETDPILKERFFGLTNAEGNHGEDVKEIYYYLDGTPTHSYMKMLYKYPQSAYPYERLLEENRQRSLQENEFELLDTGLFEDDRYFDIFIEYAKADPDDLLLKVTVHNRGAEDARLHVLPQIWFRNTWSWQPGSAKPVLALARKKGVAAEHPELGRYSFFSSDPLEWLFTENETNTPKLFGADSTGFFKDAFHEHIVAGKEGCINPDNRGTKAAAHHLLIVPARSYKTVKVRLSAGSRKDPFGDFDEIVRMRKEEADQFYASLQQDIVGDDRKHVHRQALAGMLWSKQFFYYDVRDWLKGDPGQPTPPPQRLHGRNSDWEHLNNADVISMPDKWEYPWYAAWDLAFHCIPLALIDPEFAKQQLDLLTREWYMHPNGQLPAYEWAFGDVNPPVHAWATWRVFQIDRDQNGGEGDVRFLERVFHKLMLNFTWWVNRKDVGGRNVFQGGFLGLDNIGVFDRSAPLPTGGFITQSDGTSWMAMFSLNLMRIALELALHNPVYEDIATKFFEHFLLIARAMTMVGGEGMGLWDEEDGFFYDVLNLPDNSVIPLRLRSMVGLIPLFAVETLEPELLSRLPDFSHRLKWVLENRPELADLVSRWHEPGSGERRLLSLLRGHRMKCLLRRMLNPEEFLSDYGVRALSREHLEKPYEFDCGRSQLQVSYQPGESSNNLFGGNSNWRGPIWFPVNYLIIESLLKFHHYYGDDFRIECPTGSGQMHSIRDVARELAHRLSRLFLTDSSGSRPVLRYHPKLASDPHFKDHVLFHEYFHGDSGRGVGASHQTGWTGLVAELVHNFEPPEVKPRRRRSGDKESVNA